MDQAEKNRVYTYAEYLNYPEGERVELIDGQIYGMVPAPSRIHQKIIMELAAAIHAHIKVNKGDCEVYPAPFDVIMTDADEIENSRNVVQPDISVICDKNKLTAKGCTGAPDMIIEIVSPYNPTSDYVRKLSLYSQNKVREYWIVNPMKEHVLVYRLDDNMIPDAYTFKDKVPVGIFEGLVIDFNGFTME